MPGVSDVERSTDGRSASSCVGDLDPVVKALAAHHVTDLEVSRPSPGGGLPRLLRRRGGGAMSSQLGALIASHLYERRRSLLAWGLPLGLMSAFIVAIYPSVRGRADRRSSRSYPAGLKQAFGIGELSNVEQYLHAEMLSLIVPLAVGYLAVRAVASGLGGRRGKRPPRRWSSRRRSRARRSAPPRSCATAVEVAAVLALTLVLSRARQPASPAPASPSGSRSPASPAVWPLALLVAGAGVVLSGFSLQTSVVTGLGGGAAGRDVRDRPGRQARHRASPASATPRSSATTATRSKTGSNRPPSSGLTAFGVLLTVVGGGAVRTARHLHLI